jgi:hypothetical protein
MLIKRLLERVSKPEPAMSSVGYWIGSAGVAVTLVMVLGSFVVPSIRESKFLKVPACLILAGLALEGYEAIAANRKGGRSDES